MKIFMAAAGTLWNGFRKFDPIIELFNKKDCSLFYSYLHCRPTTLSVEHWQNAFNICDSGAHSFFTSSEEIEGIPTAKSKKKEEMKDPDEFILKYIKWMVKNYNNFDFFVELDIQDLVGYKKILKWRKLYQKAGVWDKVIPCFHECNSFAEFKKMVDSCESRYVGLEGVRSGRKRLPYNKLIKYCYDNNCLVHGFALVRPEYLNAYPFYSVDSSSMTYMYRCELVYRWNKETNSIKQVRAQRSSFTEKNKEYLFKNLVSPDRVKDMKQETVAKHLKIWTQRFQEAIDVVKKQEEYYTKLWLNRGIVWDESIIKRSTK